MPESSIGRPLRIVQITDPHWARSCGWGGDAASVSAPSPPVLTSCFLPETS